MWCEVMEEFRYPREDLDEEGIELAPPTPTGAEVIEKLGLRKVYEDPEVIVVTAPNEEQLKEIILNLIRERPMTVKEIHAILAGIASEDKIRKSLMRLAERGLVTMDEDGRYHPVGLF